MKKGIKVFLISVFMMLSTFLCIYVQSEDLDRTALSFQKYEVAESVVEIRKGNETIIGTLTMPKNVKTPCKAVLMLHGFAGQRNEMQIEDSNETMFGKAARTFTEQGYATLRIDFLGCGESSGKWENTTFTSQISDAEAALKYLLDNPKIADKKIAVLGLSQGGLVAACVSRNNPIVKSLILWSPVANPPYTYSNLLGEAAVQEGLTSQNKLITAKLPWGAETKLKSEFFKDLYKIDPIAEISSYNGPLQVVVGLNDDIVAPQPQSGELYIKYHQYENEIIKLQADHMLDILTNNKEPFNTTLIECLNWLNKTL